MPMKRHVDTISPIEAVGEPTGEASSLQAQQAVLVMTGWGNHDRYWYENSNWCCRVRDRSRCRFDAVGGRERGSRCARSDGRPRFFGV
jgi:hypothetical protein